MEVAAVLAKRSVASASRGNNGKMADIGVSSHAQRSLSDSDDDETKTPLKRMRIAASGSSGDSDMETQSAEVGNDTYSSIVKRQGKKKKIEILETAPRAMPLGPRVKIDLGETSNAQAKPEGEKKTGSFQRNYYRSPMSTTKRTELEGLFQRSLYGKSEGNFLPLLFKSRPRTLKKAILTASQCVPEAIQISGDSLRIICKIAGDKDKIKTIGQIDGKKIVWTEPRVLTRPMRPEVSELSSGVSYDVKGVIFGLNEDEDTLKEIAAEIGAKYIRRIGKPESTAKVVAYENGTTLPETIEVDSFRYKVKIFTPSPMRCNKCQRYGHLEAVCRNQLKCCRCGQAHNRTECENIETPKCVNCSGSHSAAYRQCPKYLETKEALKVRVVEKVPLNEAILKVKQGKMTKNEEGKANKPAKPTKKPQVIETPQELPEDQRLQLQDFIKLMGKSPFEATKLDTYKRPETASEDYFESGMMNFIVGLGNLITDKTKKRAQVVKEVLTVANAIYLSRGVRFEDRSAAHK